MLSAMLAVDTVDDEETQEEQHLGGPLTGPSRAVIGPTDINISIK